jgi:hypothetical protein
MYGYREHFVKAGGAMLIDNYVNTFVLIRTY